MSEIATSAGGAVADLPADQAIPRLVDAHGGRLYGLGLKLCGNSEDARDLVQEIFLQAYRKWDQFEGRSDPSTWLYTIGARACRRMNRRKAGEPARIEPLSALLPSGEETIPDLPHRPREPGSPAPPGDPHEDRVRREAREALDRALAELPPDFRLTLVLKDIAELSVAEVAEVLGIKEATVKTRVHRARMLLRREIARTLPRRRPEAEPAHERTVCLDLLRGKQEALDRGAPFPVPPESLCERCRALFATLDLARDACRDVAGGRLPEEVRELIVAQAG
jgi:RNA polymerase sigma-70 factor (ECF subfamily)